MRMKMMIGLLFVPLLFVLYGCSTSSSTTTTTAPFPYAGSWSGTWEDAGNAQQGTLAVAIGTDGQFTGSIVNTTQGITGSATGTVEASGSISGTFQYPAITYIMNGTIGIASNGHAMGVLKEYSGSTQIGTATIDLTKI